VISLPEAVERRDTIKSQLNRTPLEWNFFDAHASMASELKVASAKLARINGRPLSPGELGCYSSHWSLLAMHAKALPGDVMLVFEDDAIIDPYFFSDPEELIRLGNKYGMLRLSTHLAAPSEEVEILGRRRIVRFKRRVFSGLAYLVSVDVAKVLSEKLSTIHRPIDVEYDRFWAHGTPIFCVYPFAAIESYRDSHLGQREFTKLSPREWFLWKSLNLTEKLRRGWANVWRRAP
jgi:glycosyl transferase family 25